MAWETSEMLFEVRLDHVMKTETNGTALNWSGEKESDEAYVISF